MRYESFLAMLDAGAEIPGEKLALLFEKDGERHFLTFRDLAEIVRERSVSLRASKSACLGILCDGSFDCVTEILASVTAGLQTVLLDGNADETVLAEQITHSDADCLWGDEELTDLLAPSLRKAPIKRTGHVLFFTSGTTSAARAVILTEESLCASAYAGASLLPLSPEDTLLCLLPLNHVFGFVCGLLWAFQCGACTALGRGPRHFADDCAYFQPTALSVVPMLLAFLLKHSAMNPELHLLLVGAGDCTEALLRAALASGRRVSFGYGLTETSSGLALSLGEDPHAMTVCPDTEIKIAADGEILVYAPYVMMKGYYRDPEATNQALCKCFLRTGDLGWVDREGRLTVTGRKKEILVLQDGTKLFLPEYEGHIAAALDGRELAAVLTEGRPVLVIHGREEEREEIQRRLQPVFRALPRGQQPAAIRFISEPLPRTASGKIKRWEIQQKAGRL